MNTNESIEQIYDWLEQFSFDELSQEQKRQVLQSMDEETYSEMHAAFATLTGKEQPVPVRGKEKVRDAIFHSVQDKEKSPSILAVFLHRSITLGKAAIVVLALLTALIWSLSRERIQQISGPVEHLTDTIYVTQNQVVPEVVKDTVYMVQSSGKSQPDKIRETPSAVANHQVNDVPGLHIVTADERNARSNQIKQNSLKHDSLAKRFEFISM